MRWSATTATTNDPERPPLSPPTSPLPLPLVDTLSLSLSLCRSLLFPLFLSLCVHQRVFNGLRYCTLVTHSRVRTCCIGHQTAFRWLRAVGVDVVWACTFRYLQRGGSDNGRRRHRVGAFCGQQYDQCKTPKPTTSGVVAGRLGWGGCVGEPAE